MDLTKLNAGLEFLTDEEKFTEKKVTRVMFDEACAQVYTEAECRSGNLNYEKLHLVVKWITDDLMLDYIIHMRTYGFTHRVLNKWIWTRCRKFRDDYIKNSL